MTKYTILLVFCFIVQINCKHRDSVPVPTVLWHGMGDTCCFPFSLGSIKKLLEKEISGIYVKSIEIDNNIVRDYESGYFIHPNKQVEFVCEALKNDTKLSNGFNAIGFSQGGQFLRAVAQRCQLGMKNLVTLGGQHQGVYGLPNCPALSKKTCEYFREMLNYAAYSKYMQDYLVQATYWHDPLNEEEYKNASTFLADINNEREINANYVDNLKKLKRFVMVKFTEDTIVQPRESQWFEFYTPGQDREITSLKNSDIYKQDRLGLKQMDENGQIVFLESAGNHLQFTKEWFLENILPILKEQD